MRAEASWKPVEGLKVWVDEGPQTVPDLAPVLKEALTPVRFVCHSATRGELRLTEGEEGPLTAETQQFALSMAATAQLGLEKLKAVSRHGGKRDHEAEEFVARMKAILAAVMTLGAIASVEPRFSGSISSDYEWRPRDPVDWMIDLVRLAWSEVQADGTGEEECR